MLLGNRTHPSHWITRQTHGGPGPAHFCETKPFCALQRFGRLIVALSSNKLSPRKPSETRGPRREAKGKRLFAAASKLLNVVLRPQDHVSRSCGLARGPSRAAVFPRICALSRAWFVVALEFSLPCHPLYSLRRYLLLLEHLPSIPSAYPLYHNHLLPGL